MSCVTFSPAAILVSFSVRSALHWARILTSVSAAQPVRSSAMREEEEAVAGFRSSMQVSLRLSAWSWVQADSGVKSVMAALLLRSMDVRKGRVRDERKLWGVSWAVIVESPERRARRLLRPAGTSPQRPKGQAVIQRTEEPASKLFRMATQVLRCSL